MQTALYAILHMFVDGTCALAMFGWFTEGEQGYVNILLYNFYAFALQMPFGTVLDLQMRKDGRRIDEENKLRPGLPLLYAATGVLFTILGVFTHPIVLGIGNALFHVGGGVDVLREDFAKCRKGRALGIFVAPGALGLYVGSLAAKSEGAAEKGNALILLITVMIVMAGLVALLVLTAMRGKQRETALKKAPEGSVECSKAIGAEGTDRADRTDRIAGVYKDKAAMVLVCCLLVVILRSYVGMAVSFPWKTTVAMGFLSVLAVVCGKMAGGFLAATFGMRKVMVISLLLSAGCYLFCGHAGFGIAAQFFFNMTMPITLYLLAERYRRLLGFSFGLLTFGLFLGFLPVYLEIGLPLSGSVIGSVGSLVSMLLLSAAGRWGDGGLSA